MSTNAQKLQYVCKYAQMNINSNMYANMQICTNEQKLQYVCKYARMNINSNIQYVHNYVNCEMSRNLMNIQNDTKNVVRNCKYCALCPRVNLYKSFLYQGIN